MTDHTIVDPAAAATRPADPVSTRGPGRAYQLRRRAGALCLPATFVVMIAGTALLDPLDDTANETVTVHDAVGHAGQIAALGWLEILTALLSLAGVLTVVGAVRARGAGWATATAVFAALASVGFVGIALNHFVVSGLTDSTLSTDQRVEALTRFHHAGGPLVVLFIIGVLGFVLAAVAAWRSRLSSPLVLVPAAGLLVASVAPGDVAEYVAFVAGLVMAAWIARDLFSPAIS